MLIRRVWLFVVAIHLPIGSHQIALQLLLNYHQKESTNDQDCSKNELIAFTVLIEHSANQPDCQTQTAKEGASYKSAIAVAGIESIVPT